MKIINYNKINHDIYTFANEDTMVLCSLPTNVNEVPPGTRTHATVTGWNYAGLWNTNIDNVGIPDWSGLSARSRGSNLYGTPTQFLKTDLVTDFNAGSSDSKFSDITNWNNGIPVFIIISKKHFIACAHFTGTNTTQSFNILNKDGDMYTITGVRVSEALDTNLYRITSINGTTDTEITPVYKIKIYEILNLQSGNWEGLRIWHQLNNGMFVTTTRVNGQIAYNNACEGRSTTPSVASGLPILAGSSTFWTGDSGSPILATYNGETYLIGMSDGGHPYYSSPEAWEFLRSNLANDGIIKTLVDQVIAYNIGTPLSVNSYKSRFTTDTDLLIYNNTYNYVNMIYHGFYGGTSLQSQELNELQENIQNQLSLSNTLTGNWLEYDNNINIHGEILGGIYAVDGLTADIFVPLNPKNITDNTTNTHNDWYLYKDNNGYQQFIILHHETVSHSMYYNNIKSRIVSGQDPNWAILKDTNNSTTFDNTGAHRIQLYYLTSQPDTTTQPPTEERRSQIYAFSWFPISGSVQDWTGNLPDGLPGVGGTAEVTEFSHVKPMVRIDNDYNIIDPETEIWRIQVIRDQLRMLDEYNNLPNTNIKNILPARYHSGWLYGKDTFSGITNSIDDVNGDTTIRSNTGHLIWPDKEIPILQADWIEYLTLIDGNLQNEDGLRIAKTRIVLNNEYIGNSNNFLMNKLYYDALVADERYNQTKYGAPSLSSQLGGITWNGEGVAFCSPSCGFNTDYLVWNKSVEKISTAAISEALLKPFKQRYTGVSPEFRAMNYQSNITILGDGYPGVNGHNMYHDNIFGNSANIELYGRQNPGSNVWCIDSTDDTKLKRIISNETSFEWWNPAAPNGPWNAFMTTVQGVRSVKRGLMDRGLTNTSIGAWIGPKDWVGATTASGLVGFVNTQYYDEMVRHVSLTGVEVFGFFNGLQFTTTSLSDRAQRRVQFGVINAILVDINDKLGGYTPTTLDDTRVSYNCQFVMSGAPTKDGTYLWRVTPKVSTDKIFSNGVLVPKTGSEIGVWITTTTSTKPSIIIAP